MDWQRARKGLFWRTVEYTPNKLARYKITKETKKLYGLNNKEYQMLKALTNRYGIYDSDTYDDKRPLKDVKPGKLEQWLLGLEGATA